MNARVQWLEESPGTLGRVEWIGFGYEEGTPVWQPGLSEEEKKSYFPWGQYSDATKNLQGAINGFLATKGCGKIATDGKLGAGTCAAAKLAVSLGGPEGVVGPPPTCQSFGTPPKCGGGGEAPGGGGGGISPPGGGGGGVSPPPPAEKSGMGVLGIVLLAGAALGAIYLATRGVGQTETVPAT